jgi:hypothetical protein
VLVNGFLNLKRGLKRFSGSNHVIDIYIGAEVVMVSEGVEMKADHIKRLKASITNIGG